MKKISLLLLLLLPFTLFSISSDSTSTGDSTSLKKTELGISFSPDYCFRTLKPDDSGQLIADYRDTLEIPKFGYTTGLAFAFSLNKKINIETGILFADSGEKTKKFSLENVPFGQEPIRYSYNYHYYYLNIPIRADYTLYTGSKLKFYIIAGVSANIFLTEKITSITNYANSNTRVSSWDDPGFSRISLAILAGCGVKYPIGKKANLKVEPLYRHSITSIIKAPVKGYLYSAGLNIGIYYNL